MAFNKKPVIQIGGFYLHCLDAQFENKGLYYVRYMDDILILAPTRWKLRKAVRMLNESFRQHQLEKHPDKTFIGRIEKGFDFLGYQFNTTDTNVTGLTISRRTLENFVTRYRRLYEQKKTAPDCEAVLGDYVRRWWRWVFAALENELSSHPFCITTARESQTDKPQTQ